MTNEIETKTLVNLIWNLESIDFFSQYILEKQMTTNGSQILVSKYSMYYCKSKPSTKTVP